MDKTEIRLRAGDWVEVRTAQEIAQTLDQDGALEGVPFMPEMIEFLGKRFRVVRQARKACVECLSAKWKSIDMREFRDQGVWVLEGLRCTGEGHDGCQRGCLLFWKTAWLRKSEASGPVIPPVPPNHEELRAKLKVLAAPGRYFCQSTELEKTTKPLSPRGRFRLCVADIWSGDVGIIVMIKLIFLPLFWKTVHRFIPRHVVGTLTRTPVGQLDLKPGETVEVKSAQEIAQTLNEKGCNRGLRYDRGLNKFCGTRQRVRERLDRMIVESTGQMIQMQGTVTLEGCTCLCYRSAVGGCSRQDPVYWREVWLKRGTPVQ